MKAIRKKRLLYTGLAIAGTAICVALGGKGKLGFNHMGYYRDDPDDDKWYDGGPDDDAIDEDDPDFVSPTGTDRLPEESDEDYQERMEDLYGY